MPSNDSLADGYRRRPEGCLRVRRRPCAGGPSHGLEAARDEEAPATVVKGGSSRRDAAAEAEAGGPSGIGEGPWPLHTWGERGQDRLCEERPAGLVVGGDQAAPGLGGVTASATSWGRKAWWRGCIARAGGVGVGGGEQEPTR